ncbi:testis-expressed protein 47 isoform X1 [Osmia lignaria lignaria]|uniref:testis-expressed protein 47 isoform X1 n=1 Tax=Osmia lignaria lignaria TaxID=1437193 RepID=UPI001478D12C|nr:testis-expressed protein 47-like isoform X1 [Osmia lignaria]
MKRVTEPVRKSLLDVVKKNLRTAGKITYLTRMVNIGMYGGTDANLEKKIESIIHDLQAEYTNVPITGLLLVYPQYYVHVLEASEEIIYKQFKVLYGLHDFDLGKSIFLPSHHHAHQRFFTEWFYIYAIPPSLFDIPRSYELDDIKGQVSNCLKKVYRFCDSISNAAHDSLIPMQDVVSNMGDAVTRVLPESTVIEYLLNAKTTILLSVEEYLKVHSKVPFINLYQDSIWPPPYDFMFGDGCEKDVHRIVDSSVSKH